MYRKISVKKLEEIIKRNKEDALRAELAKMTENPVKYKKVLSDGDNNPPLLVDRP